MLGMFESVSFFSETGSSNDQKEFLEVLKVWHGQTKNLSITGKVKKERREKVCVLCLCCVRVCVCVLCVQVFVLCSCAFCLLGQSSTKY